ncbi:MAG: MFS transporter [Tepidimonas ignava]|uniref:MFS transporter n=1 Tax=Tepidimonas ignava TaxID=114249 RepID=UPI002A303042|nr:MFS transporter [Tepidimonas ignava]
MSAAADPTAHGWRYGLPGLPLAFAALPLYVHVPHHYATLGVPLAALGGVLLVARVADALTDPLIGRGLDRVFRRGAAAVLRLAWPTALLLWCGMAALLRPPALAPGALAWWALACVVATALAYSVLTIAHQSWGARLGGDAAQQARIVAWREGCTLVGVVTASVLPTLAGWNLTLAMLAGLLLAGWLAWTRAPRPPAGRPGAPAAPMAELGLPWRRPAFRWLMGVFVLSGLASAIPATLVLFYVGDRLQAAHAAPWLLAAYFVAAAAAMPLWLAWVRRVGVARAWLTGMLLSIGVFGWTATLGAGDVAAFAWVCVLSGAALGADLALPAALLANVVADVGDRGQREGAYFGWWNLAAKGNLALAAGVALPVLELLGYTPGTRDPAGLQALTWAYAVLPCGVKALAAWWLWQGLGRHHHRPAPVPPMAPPV